MADALTNHLVLVRREPRDFRVRHRDGLDRYPRVEAQRPAGFVTLGEVGGAPAPGMGADGLARQGRRGVRHGKLAQGQLRRRRLGPPLLTFLAEQLTAEPVELALRRRQLAAGSGVRLGQFDDLLGRPEAGFGGGRNGAEVSGQHGASLPQPSASYRTFDAGSGR